MTDEATGELAQRIESIEAGYEFMLAYAAQGHVREQDAGPGRSIRKYLQDMDGALDNLGKVSASAAKSRNPDSHHSYHDFLAALESDAVRARGAIKLVLAQASISSQLIDNLNASIHLRALLTDLFVLDEALKS